MEGCHQIVCLRKEGSSPRVQSPIFFQLGTPLSIKFSTEIQPVSKSSKQQNQGKKRETEGNIVQHTMVGKPVV
jgi:hypothetical protein